MSQQTEPIAATLTREDIERGLRTLGLNRGAAVEVHSSLSRFGWVEDGAPTVVDALMNVVGEEGTLVMSAYSLSAPLPLTEEDKARGLIAKVQLYGEDYEGKTGMGAIVDEFRKRPGTVLGRGMHRVCAWGREAQRYAVEGYARLLDVDGWALLIGVSIGRLSSMHQAEGATPLPESLAALMRVPEAEEIARHYPNMYIQLANPRLDPYPWLKVWHEAERRGLIRHHLIGHADCTLFRARSVVSIYEQWRRTDPWGLFSAQGDDASARSSC